MLNELEQKKFDTIKQLETGNLTRKEASYDLGLSLRQIDRLRKIYKNEGEEGFIHKGRGRENKRKINRNIIEEIEQLYLTEYYDYNFEHFFEVIKDRYDISYPSLHRQFLYDDIISPIAHKETIKLYNNNMKMSNESGEEKPEKIIELYESRMITHEQAHIRRSCNMFAFGQEVQMDACQKAWFGNIPSYLHLAVDKATKKVLFGWFEYEEITRGYFVLLYNIIINYGIPARIKTDNRNSFSNKQNEVNNTQFGIICNMLEIELITTSVATAKANVERTNKTFKDRLIAELRHENITDIDGANRYVNEIFIPKMNKKFSYEIDEATSKMRKNDYTIEELNLIISEKYTRIIDNASSIKYNSKYYIPIDSNTGEIICFMKKTQCTFIINYNGDYWCQIDNNYYKLRELKNRDDYIKKEIQNKKPVERKKCIPPASHPWRTNMMRR